MNNFIVSARKYRPDTFDTVVGQHSITQTLKNAIKNNHLAQAFLFCGPRGVGKTTTARILAKTINCQNISEGIEACNQCDSCVSFNSGQSLNIYELDAASNNSVDDIRALVEQVRYAPQGGKYKVYIIDEVHMLSTSAFNAFLKTLEEPPSYALFILATTEKHKIIPTILSRCQIFDFSRIRIEDIAGQLGMIAKNENVEAEEDALHVIAQKADGAMRDALSMFDQQVSFAGNHLTYKSVIENLNVLDYDYYFRVTNEILLGNTSAVLLIYNDVLNYGFDGHNFITGVSSHFRDLLVCQDEATLKLIEVSPNVREKYKIQSKQCSPQFLLELLDIANKCDMNYRGAKHQRLHVELTLMKMCTLNGDKKKDEPVRPAVVHNPQPAATAKAPSVPIPNIASEPPPVPVKTETVNVKSQTPVEVSAPKQAQSTKSEPSLRSTISITQSLKPKEEQQKATSSSEPFYGEMPFIQDELEKCWFDFAEKVLDGGRKALKTALLKQKPELKENFKIYFTVDNAAIEKDVNSVKSDLLGHLRKKLNNGKISLETVISKQAFGKKIPYTPKEKYDHLVSKNPALIELKKQLDLDIEF